MQAPAFGASLAISGLATAGVAAHEVTLEEAVDSMAGSSAERDGRLAAAA